MSIRVLALSLAVTTAVVAQCPFSSVTAVALGQGCSAVFPGSLPSLAVALDGTACRLDVDVLAIGGCCNTYLVGRVLVIGDAPALVPLPQFGPGCTLQVSAPIVLFQPSGAGATFALPLGAALPPLTVHAQGAALYFTTIGFSYDWALSGGYQIDLG